VARRLVLPQRIDAWWLTGLQQRLVKTGGRLVKYARYYWLLLAEGHLHRPLFGQMLRRFQALPVPSGQHSDCACKIWGRGRRDGAVSEIDYKHFHTGDENTVRDLFIHFLTSTCDSRCFSPGLPVI
jgi:hypothetical protein